MLMLAVAAMLAVMVAKWLKPMVGRLADAVSNSIEAQIFNPRNMHRFPVSR